MDLLDGILSMVPYVGSIVVGIAIMSVLRRRVKDQRRKHVLTSGRRTHVRPRQWSMTAPTCERTDCR